MEYKIKIHPKTKEKTITEDGHFMFIEDVLKRLKRISFLEKELSNL